MSLPAVAGAETHLIIATRPDPSAPFYEAVVRRAVARLLPPAGVQVLSDLPQPRIEAMLDDGRLTLHAFVAVDSRDSRWVPVPVNLTGGLIGQRVFIIRPADQARFDRVRTVEDLRQLTAAFGQGWGDVAIWQANRLPVQEYSGDWTKIYSMLPRSDRGIDYFSRAIHEAVPELTQHDPDRRLSVEAGLLVRYDRDMQFYLSKAAAARWLGPLTAVLRGMEADGTLASLVQENAQWQAAIAPMHRDRRRVIDLVTPPLSLRNGPQGSPTEPPPQIR